MSLLPQPHLEVNPNLSFNEIPIVIQHLVDRINRLEETLTQEKNLVVRMPINVHQVAEILGLSVSRVYVLTGQKKLPSYKTRGRVYYFQDEIIDQVRLGKRSLKGNYYGK
jgi:excisionase family DNA binding protein